ncbi:hypothetical protein FA95DRAFT_1037009 [Auriscalpium vulgare]|uniref:Uncharacterized protein n=1 Tax=Auriscalpium vulgare TaxID=40419 RepID=A0ACB8RWM3_9AGAM|nr:hypothetical protein FA95DRAFT_1037009 [Auriscalpium vulgare]
MVVPSEGDKLVSTLTAEFITAVAHKLSIKHRYDKATNDQEWMRNQVDRYSKSMLDEQRTEIITGLGDLDLERLKINVKDSGFLGVLTVRKYRKVRRYQKATQEMKERVRVASDYARIVEMQELLRQQNLNDASGQAEVNSEAPTEPEPAMEPVSEPATEPEPALPNSDTGSHTKFSFIATENSPSGDTKIAMQAIVENDENHLYTATFTKRNSEIKDMHDATTGTFVPT